MNITNGKRVTNYIRIRVRSILGSAIIAAGVVLGIAALGESSSSRARDPNLPEFPANAGSHVTRGDPQSEFNLQKAGEIPAQDEVRASQSPVPSTRSSFMARWQRVSGAIGYRLDVSTSASFDNYVDGYYDLDVGNVSGRAVTGLSQGTTYYYRVRAYDGAGTTSESSTPMTGSTSASVGLIIKATFDSSITTRANAATIEAMINRAIAVYESLFSDPITIQILFRYASTMPNGSPLPAGLVAGSTWPYYAFPWSTYINALKMDGRTSNDFPANMSLPGSALSPNINPSSAGGRAVRLNTPPAMFANGTVAAGGPYDGIVMLNSAKPFQFTRPVSAGYYDGQTVIEHEIDEVMGLGSRLNLTGGDLRPQDLFSWSSPNIRNLTSSGTRYFSINKGTTNIVNFNQNPMGDFGDWLSTACPQVHPYVQNAFGCTGQYSDVTVKSPEGINLDVIGYDLVNSPAPVPIDFDVNNDGKPDFVLYNSSTAQTVIWYMNNNVRIGSANGPAVPAGWRVVSGADFNRDGHIDAMSFNPTTRQTLISYLFQATLLTYNYGPTLPSGWSLIATGDFNSDHHPDFVLYNPATRQTAIWYLNNNVFIGSAAGPTLPLSYSVVGIADFNRDGHPDYLLFNSGTRQTAIWYMNNNVHVASATGPTLPAGWSLMGTADFNRDGRPDYVLYNSGAHQTAIWYMSNNARVASASGPTLPLGWSLVAP
jgi:hypothetical protein